MSKNIILCVTCLFLTMGYMAMNKKDPLAHYKAKRDLSRSTEPIGKKIQPSKEKPLFVIQKHDSSRLHYDFRLEIDGVLVSWAVPKGPSTDHKEKRLAIRTEDHPLDYATFEGVIPQGHYGAGPVMVWDIGTFKNIKEKDGTLVPLDQCLKNGQIEVWLEGKKLKGGYALIRMKRKNQWLLIKMKDEYDDARRKPVNTENKSALTGKTMHQIEKIAKS